MLALKPPTEKARQANSVLFMALYQEGKSQKVVRQSWLAPAACIRKIPKTPLCAVQHTPPRLSTPTCCYSEFTQWCFLADNSTATPAASPAVTPAKLLQHSS